MTDDDSTTGTTKRYKGKRYDPNYHKKKNTRANEKTNNEQFAGNFAELNGNIFDCSGPKQADQYVTTKREIEEYIGTNYVYGNYIKWTIENNELMNMQIPTDPDTEASETEKLIWKKEVKEYVKRKSRLKENLIKAYILVWGQCTELMKAKLETLTTYVDMKRDNNTLQLLNEIKAITYKFEDHMYLPHSLYQAYRSFYLFRQKTEDNNSQYLEQFKNTVDILNQ